MREREKLSPFTHKKANKKKCRACQSDYNRSSAVPTAMVTALCRGKKYRARCYRNVCKLSHYLYPKSDCILKSLRHVPKTKLPTNIWDNCLFHPFQGLIPPRNMSIVQRERERRTRPERKCLSLFIKFSVPWPLLCLLNFSGQKITASRSTNTAFSKPGLHTTSPVRPNNAGCLFRLCQQTNARLPSTQPPHEAGQAERKSV